MNRSLSSARDSTARTHRPATIDGQSADALSSPNADDPRWLQVLIDSVPALLSYVDRDLRYRNANRLYEHWLGRPRAEIVGKLVSEVVDASMYERLKPRLEQALAGVEVTFDECVSCHDGVKAVSVVYIPHRASDGTVNGIVVYVRDVTARHATEMALRTRTERLELLSSFIGHLLHAKRPEGIVQELFPKLAAHLGLDLYFNFVVNETKDALRLVSCGGLDAEEARLIERLEFGEAICGTVAVTKTPYIATAIQESTDAKAELVRGFGCQVYACYPLLSGNELVGTLSFASRTRTSFADDELQFMRFISQYVSVALTRLLAEQRLAKANETLDREVEKRTARLRESVDELEAFSYSITHDMRAPLRAMQAFAEALEEETAGRLRPTEQDYLRRIAAAAERMDKLISDVLAYSKVLRSELRLEPVDVGALVVGILESYPDLQKVRTNISLEGDFPLVMGNEAALTQCVSNFLSNAVKFVRPGQTPRVRIWTERRDGRVRVWFEDDGIGIEPAYRERIFGLFQRLDRRYEGTGMGLSIARKAAERMGGQIGFEPAPVQGSRFWVELRGVPPADE